MGRRGSFSPSRPRRIARATAVTASSCPITRAFSKVSRERRRIPSESAWRDTGIPVHCVTTSEMCSFSITGTREAVSLFSTDRRASYSLCTATASSRSFAARSKSCPTIASSFSIRSRSSSAFS